ncbi:MAG: hypothetical protein IJ835_02550 [Muribaculaceae bacterium]|nr:hypothetical protein [Muribaculaceae bacterium]
MDFLRTFHPVGHGAFFTERFYDGLSDTPIFNVVYDCGNKDKTHLKGLINATFKKEEHIDLMFISHFDSDHISGIDFIIKEKHIDANTIIVIPFKFPRVLTVMTGAYNKIATTLSALYSAGAYIIGVDNGELPNNTERVIDYEELHNQTHIQNGTKIRFKQIWYYVPFMSPERSSLLDKFQDALKNNPGIDENRLNDSDYINSKQKDIRKLYKNIGDNKSNSSLTIINMNSLLVLSFSADVIESWSDNYCYHRFCCRYYRCCHHFSLRVSCLYTGDCDLSNSSVFGKVIDFSLKQLQRDAVELLQIPHHGSINNYGSHIANCDQFLHAFINCDPYYHQRILSNSLLIDFAKCRRTPILVTKEISTRFMHYAFIN